MSRSMQYRGDTKPVMPMIQLMHLVHMHSPCIAQHAMLCCAVLCCAVLCCAVLYCAGAVLRCNALRCADLSVLWSGMQPVPKGTLTSLLDDTGCLSGSSPLSLPARTDPFCKAAFFSVVSSGPFFAGFLCGEGSQGQSLLSTTTNKDDNHNNSSNGNYHNSNINFVISVDNSIGNSNIIIILSKKSTTTTTTTTMTTTMMITIIIITVGMVQ